MYKKSQLRIIFLLYLSLSFLILGVFSFQGGTGTLADPYNISTCIELQNMSFNLSAHYQLVDDIDCSVPPFNSAPWFSPIGNCTGSCDLVDPNDFPFTGSFNGNYFTISNLTIINTSGTGNLGWGLFGFVNNGTISNISLENAFINVSDNFVGGLVGISDDSSVINSYSSGSVSGDTSVGGLVGISDDSSVINSSSSGSVSGNNNVGGLVGYFYLSSIINSYSSSSVSGNISIGGLVGQSYDSSVLNSYSSGSVSGNNVVGGLVGISHDDSVINSSSSGSVSGNNEVGGLFGYFYLSSMINSYSSSSVSGNNFVGGLVGYSYDSSIINSYSSGSVSGNNSVGGLVGINTYDSSISNSFTTSNVNGINSSSTGGLVGVNDGDFTGFGGPTTITNSFYYNSTESPSRAIGFDDEGASVISESNLFYFYDNTNAPFIGNWDSGVWNFTGTSLPFLQGHENPFSVSDSPVVSESTASLFPFGGILVSLMLVLGFFLF